MSALRLLVIACAFVMINADDMDIAKDYFMTYTASEKYMEENPAFGSLTQPHEEEEMIKAIQRSLGLLVTGELDQDTMTMMARDRCGNRDILTIGSDMKRRKKRYALFGSRWSQNDLTYRISGYTNDLSRQEQDRIFEESFKRWSDVTPLTFTRVAANANADIDIFFANRSHGDPGRGGAFDGRGGTLAHAYFPTSDPIGGDAHFDDEEPWTDATTRGINLLQVTVHEIGHSLGLEHSNVQDAIMFPSYRGYVPGFQLDRDDIAGIQAIYGRPNTQNTPAPTPQPTTTTTRRTTTRRTTAGSTTTRTPGAASTTTTQRTTTESTTTAYPTPVSNLRQQFCTNLRFDAITTFGDRTYAFKDDIYAVIDETGIANGYPRYIADDWQGAPSNIDAALYWSENRPPRVYLFKGEEYWRYELNPDGSPRLRAGYPRLITAGFSGLDPNIDNAFVWGRNGRTYINKDGNYYRLFKDTSTNTTRGIVDRGYPRSNAAWRLPQRSYDAIFQWSNGRTYLFSGDQYIRYDDFRLEVDESANPPYPRPINNWWVSCSSADIMEEHEMKEEENEFIEVDPISAGDDDSMATGGNPATASTTLSDMTGSAVIIRQGALLLFAMALLARFV